MSVINKVLRDLDRRKEPDEPPARPGQSPLRAGVASVAAAAMTENTTPLPPAASAKSRRTLVLAVLTVVVLAGAVWDRMTAGKTAAVVPVPQAGPALQAAPATPALTPTAVISAPVPAPVPAPLAATTPVANAPAVRVSPPPVAAPATKAATATATTTATGSAAGKAPAAAASPATVTTSPAPTPSPVLAPGAPAATIATTNSAATPAPNPNAAGSANDPAQVVLRQQQAARDALAQGQSLWNNGSKDAAIDLLQQAVATAERSMSASSANRPQLVMLARELTRMLLADGRAQAAWDVLLRLEPQLAGDVDLLAVRANAAQRLGRHQDSVQSYTTALQSRPREQRWLLGAAVSLAALGQTSRAAEMAESARQVGPIAREVQAYLRQVGVVLREP